MSSNNRLTSVKSQQQSERCRGWARMKFQRFYSRYIDIHTSFCLWMVLFFILFYFFIDLFDVRVFFFVSFLEFR